MKKLSIMGIIAGAMFGAAANAADITIYYSPTCPHCHHARDFISNTLIYEYPDLRVTTVNVMESANRPEGHLRVFRSRVHICLPVREDNRCVPQNH